jgi:hypothetical protein
MPPFGYETKEQTSYKPSLFEGYKKQYVGVQCLYTADGKIIPQEIYFDDSKYSIDKVIDIRNAASLKAGGIGLRYTVKILGKQTYIFYDEYENKWFVEAKK